MLKTVYISLEDDIEKITTRLKREKSDEIVLVCPKRSFLFSDSINLKLLKKQIDLLGKQVSILTMDERGQAYAKEAGFKLKFLPKSSRKPGFSDVRSPMVVTAAEPVKPASGGKETVRKIKKLVKNIVPAAVEPDVAVTENIYSDISAGSDTFNLHAGMRSRSRFYNRSVLSFIGAALIIIFLLVVVILPKGDVVVYARSEPAARDIEISVSTKIDKADTDKLIVPGTLVDRTLEIRDKFQAAGKRDVGNKAEGKIAIYNLTGKPLNLKASTTTLTLGNATYYLKTDQSVKVSREDGSAAVNVADIIAEQGGESYNLPAGTRLEIANQVFGSQPQVLYAKTSAPVVGGTSRFISLISQDDIKNAGVTLTQNIIKQASAELAAKNLIMPEGAYTTNVVEFSTDKPAGTETPTFEGYENLHFTGIAFDKEALSNLVRDRISKTLGGDKKLQDASQDTLEYKVKSTDFAAQIMTVSVHYQSQVLSNVDLGDLKSQIAGKTKQEASEILLSKPEISRVDITLSPAWQQSLPRISPKIHLEIK